MLLYMNNIFMSIDTDVSLNISLLKNTTNVL